MSTSSAFASPPPIPENSNRSTDRDSRILPPANAHLPPTTHSELHSGSNHPDLLNQPQDLHLFGSVPIDPSIWQAMEGQNSTIAPFSVSEDTNIDPMNLDLYAPTGFDRHRAIDEQTGAAILGPITTFSSAVLRNQAEASVMGSLIADYIAWLRKVPSGGGTPLNEGSHYVSILDTLETRVRELCEMNQSRSSSALRELITALEEIAPQGGAIATRLASLEGELKKETQERAASFRSRYNICALLTEQARNLSQ